MYPLGLLFGLGLDTATEIALLIGYAIVGLFLGTWAIALSVWRFGQIEERWSARLERS